MTLTPLKDIPLPLLSVLPILQHAKDLTTIVVSTLRHTQRLMLTIAEAIRNANQKLPITQEMYGFQIQLLIHLNFTPPL